MRRPLLALLLTSALLAPLGTGVSAGGMAVVHLDAKPAGVLVEVPWRFGFMVLQHDVTPNSDVIPLVSAQHRDSGEKVEATGQQEGAHGHFVAEVTFPIAGEWKWSITPAPFAATSFETLTVYSSLAEASAADSISPASVSPDGPLTARVHAGTCAALGDDLPSIEATTHTATTAERTIGAQSAVSIEATTVTLESPLAELIAGDYAIDVYADESPRSGSVCGDIGGLIVDDELVVGLRQRGGSTNAGIALLRGDGERTEITVYTFQVGVMVVSSDVEIRIAQIGDWVFDPALVEVPAGATVTWVNDTDTSHTVMGRDLAFADSGPLEPGESFSQIFTVPGTYVYICGPHPNMTGTIVVTGD
ncbi:MAG: plastocyanin/azurin family copper-binding protein [Chloroflexota bacterium]|nr:plastocyanin/azurin family copper-binding protein [Chloroflexota bacterium]